MGKDLIVRDTLLYMSMALASFGVAQLDKDWVGAVGVMALAAIFVGFRTFLKIDSLKK